MKKPDIFVINLLIEIFQLPFWWWQKIHRRDPKTWLFGAWFGKAYSDSARKMYEYVLEEHPEINAIWITESESLYNKLLSDNKPVVLKGTKESKRTCLKAGYLFVTVTVNEFERLYINGAKQIWLWHGMPLKKVGADMNLSYTFKEKIHLLFPQNKVNRPDYFISLGKPWNDIMTNAFSAKNVIDFGLPRNDVFFEQDITPFIKNLNEQFNYPLKILYMPTFRDTQFKDKKAFNPFETFDFSMKKIETCLNENNAVLLYKGHFYDLLYQKNNNTDNSRFIILNESMYSDLYSLIRDIDILMTDYSSVYFDFLLLKKPVILAPFDKEDYCSKSRALYFDYDQAIEGVRAYNWDDFIKIINEKSYYTPSQNTREKYHQFQDGNSSKRITDFVLNLK